RILSEWRVGSPSRRNRNFIRRPSIRPNGIASRIMYFNIRCSLKCRLLEFAVCLLGKASQLVQRYIARYMLPEKYFDSRSRIPMPLHKTKISRLCTVESIGGVLSRKQVE